MAIALTQDWADIATVHGAISNGATNNFTLSGLAVSDRALVFIVGVESTASTLSGDITGAQLQRVSDDAVLATTTFVAGVARGVATDRAAYIVVFDDADIAAVLDTQIYCRLTLPDATHSNNEKGRYAIFSGVHQATPLVGTQTPAAGNNITTDSAALTSLPAGSYVLAAAVHSSLDITFTWTSPLAKITGNERNVDASATIGIAFAADQTGDVTCEWTAASATWAVTMGTALQAATVSGPTITDIDADNVVTSDQTNIVATVSGAEASQGTGSLVLISGSYSQAQTIDTWSDTSIQFDAVRGSLPYGQMTARLTNDSAETADKSITFNPPSGFSAYSIASGTAVTGTQGSLFSNLSGSPSTGDQVVVPTLTDEGVSITVDVDGSGNATGLYVIGSGFSSPDQFDFEYWDSTTGTWSSGTVFLSTGDTVPDAITNQTKQDVGLGATVAFDAFNVLGIDTSTTIGISGATGSQYAIDGGAPTSSPGSVSAGQSVVVTHTSSGANATNAVSTLVVGGISATFTSRTLAAETTDNCRCGAVIGGRKIIG